MTHPDRAGGWEHTDPDLLQGIGRLSGAIAGAIAAACAYDGIWIALPFLPEAIVPTVLDRARQALRPDGFVLPGTFAGPPDPLAQLLVDLRTVRSGGRPWRSDELCAARR